MNSVRTLTRAQLRELERELLRERARLARSLNRNMETDGAQIDAGTPRNFAVGEPGSLDSALETRKRARYDAVLSSLARLTSGAYGTCLSCRKPIPYGRLSVMPEAKHCVACGSGV